MATLRFGEKAVVSEKHQNFWDISSRYSLEAECIQHYLKDQAAINWKKYKEKTNEKTVDAFNIIKAEIARAYTGDTEASSTAVAAGSIIKDKVKDGSLKNECPSSSTIILLYLAVLFTVCIEFSVLMVQSFSDNPFIIVFALVLACGGVCQGIGFGNLYYNRWLEETRREDNDRKKSIPFVVGGTVFIVLVAGVRGYFGGPIIFLTTLVLGVLVCIAETFLKFLSARRRQCFHDLEQAQKDYSAEMHRVALEKHHYLDYYKAQLRLIDEDGSTNGKVADMMPGGAFT